MPRDADYLTEIGVSFKYSLSPVKYQGVNRRPCKAHLQRMNQWRRQQHISEALQSDHENARPFGENRGTVQHSQGCPSDRAHHTLPHYWMEGIVRLSETQPILSVERK